MTFSFEFLSEYLGPVALPLVCYVVSCLLYKGDNSCPSQPTGVFACNKDRCHSCKCAGVLGGRHHAGHVLCPPRCIPSSPKAEAEAAQRLSRTPFTPRPLVMFYPGAEE